LGGWTRHLPVAYKPLVNRRDFLRWSAAAGLGACGVGLYAFEIEPHWVTVVERDLPVKDLPPALAGARLVQISDCHVGPKVSDEYPPDLRARIRPSPAQGRSIQCVVPLSAAT